VNPTVPSENNDSASAALPVVDLTGENSNGEEPVSPATSPANPLSASNLPWTVYLWLGIILIAVLIPRIAGGLGWTMERGRPVKEALTDTEFKKYVEASQNIRSAFADTVILEGLQKKDLPTANLDTAKRRAKSLATAITLYESLEKTAAVPNISRTLLILEHSEGHPLNESRLKGSLTKALLEVSKNPLEIDAELDFWRTLYGEEKPKSRSEPLAEQEKRVRDFDLHFLHNRCLADLYVAYGEKDKALIAQRKFDEEAISYRLKEGVSGILILLAFAIGLGVLAWTLRAVLLRNWSDLGRIQEPPAVEPSWGKLVDAFACFFAALMTTRVVFSIITATIFKNPNVTAILFLSVAGYLIPAILAISYLSVMARREGATLSGIGLTSKNLGMNIVYGILGYCAALPLISVLALITRAIFHDNPDVTPNPIMPLITAERGWEGRLLLFLLVSVAAPLVEEIFFRGVLQTGLRQRFGILWAIFLSAVVFALGHPMQDWIPILGLGIAFGTLRELRQSLVPGIVAHFIQNSLTFFALTTLFSQ